MPRQARIKSENGIYHIMLRGINQQQIFYDTEDCEKYLKLLWEQMNTGSFDIFAFCFMGNHLHLLLQEKKEPMSLIFKKIGSKYVYWYNAKYQRSGHLFQDRFKSLPIEDDAYFLSALRYIHNNPVVAGLVRDPIDYHFSSYHYYFEKQFFIDCDFVWKMINKEQFRDFHFQTDTYSHLEIEEQKHMLTEEQAQAIIKKICRCNSVADYQKMDYQKQKEYISDFYKAGISIRQISRLTGLPKGVVERNRQ